MAALCEETTLFVLPSIVYSSRTTTSCAQPQLLLLLLLLLRALLPRSPSTAATATTSSDYDDGEADTLYVKRHFQQHQCRWCWHFLTLVQQGT